MSTVDILIQFHSPFRVGGAYPVDGLDQAIDRIDPLPADSLKGVMRAAAAGLLGREHSLVAAVFGTTTVPAAWAWTGARPTDDQQWRRTTRHRVAIDPEELTAMTDHLVMAEQVWVEQASFTIQRVRYLSPQDEHHHLALLKVSAGAVHALGAWRRRGLGWVHLRPAEAPVSPDDVARVLSLRSGTPVTVAPTGEVTA